MIRFSCFDFFFIFTDDGIKIPTYGIILIVAGGVLILAVVMGLALTKGK